MPNINEKPSRGWNLTITKARSALVLLPKDRQGDVNWSGVDVAQIDTGYTQHPVFGDFTGGQTHINFQAGRNYIELGNGQDPIDPINYDGLFENPGHGSRIGSILCGLKIARHFDGGVAPGLPLIPYRVTNTVHLGPPLGSKRYRLNAADAIRHAIDINDVDVINISLGVPSLSPFGSRPLGKAIDEAYESGVIVCAAGGQVTDRVTYPGKFYRTIGCGGIDPDKTIWNTADQSYDEHDLIHIDVWAPGNLINRPVIKLDDDGNLDIGTYKQEGSGTSYATAHVSAAAAMWIAKHGENIANLYGDKPWMRVEAFRYLIKHTAQPIAGDQRPYSGTGILDVKKLISETLPAPSLLVKETRKAEDMWI